MGFNSGFKGLRTSVTGRVKTSCHFRDIGLEQDTKQSSRMNRTSFIGVHVLIDHFIGPCIVIYSYSTTNKMHLLSQIIYSCKTVCMRSGTRWNCVPSHPRSQQLFDIYRCCIRSFELLIMDGKID